MKINKEALRELALSLHFELDEIQLQKLFHESEFLLTSLEELDNLNVDVLSPMHYPINRSCNTLRADEPKACKNPEEYLQNVKKRFGKYVVVK
jgi:aspartyl/glutamyl-tRNA(Asn/Gln) amidotransferase C subunit